MGCGNSTLKQHEEAFSDAQKKSESADLADELRYNSTNGNNRQNTNHKKDIYLANEPSDTSDSGRESADSRSRNAPKRRRSSSTTDERDDSLESVDAPPKANGSRITEKVQNNIKRHSDEFTSDEDMTPNVSPHRRKSNPKASQIRSQQSVSDDEGPPVVMGHDKISMKRERSRSSSQGSTEILKAKQSASTASIETQIKAVVRMQKLFRQRKHWKRIIEEREWKIFNDLDTQDEADMLNLACFMQTLLDWNADHNGEGSDTHNALNVDSDAEDHPHPVASRSQLKKDESIRTARSVSVHSSASVYGNSLDYHIPKGTLSSKVAEDIIAVYKKRGKLSLKSIQKILRFSYKTFKKLETVSKIKIEKGEKVTVVGDLHGQLGDLFHILEESGWPSPTNKYIFNGDFVDRGEQGVEVVCVILSLFAAMPDCVYMNRGNHEDHAICCVYGFEKEVKDKYDELTFGMFVEVFRHIPLFTIINEEVFVVHGGLFHDVNVRLEDLSDIDRTDYAAKPPVPYPECCNGLGPEESRKEYLKQLQRDALWSDPNEFEVLSKNSRGSGVVFGPEVTRRFLKNNKLHMVVRSHECVREGFDQPFSGAFQGLLCTVFSASNYCGGNNDAAYMTFTCHSRSGGRAIPHSKTNLQYSVHHFNLSDAKQSLRAANHDNIREMILRKSKALQQAFETADVTCSKVVTKIKWSEIMQRVTGLKILWLAIIKELSPECVNGNLINYSIFLKSLKKSVEENSAITVDSLYGQRQKLETIFHFFDKNGDGSISREEFRKGCDFMNTTLPPDQQLRDYDHILDLMDFDQSDTIDINEFFEVFRILDAKDGVVDGVISLAAKH